MDTRGLENKKIWILVGTRPEVIKQVPLYQACVKRFGAKAVALVGTGQHKELLTQALAPFGVELDINLDIMKPDQSLTMSSAAILQGLDMLFRQTRPEWLVVQGDTSSAVMAAVAAFQHRILVAHNEAGLRSYDLRQPFPEEANRKMIAVVADLHLAPTTKAADVLRREGAPDEKIHVVGNTGIDAFLMMLSRPAPAAAQEIIGRVTAKGCRPVLLTAHRRENAADRVDSWFKALADFLKAHPDLALVYPTHPNKMSQDAAAKHLSTLDRAFLVPPLDYPSTCHVLNASRFVVTDSGGIQEEGATLGLPVVICRERTERTEAIDAGVARLAGTDTQKVLDAMEWAYKMSESPRVQKWPFGDGKSSPRIADILAATMPS